MVFFYSKSFNYVSDWRNFQPIDNSHQSSLYGAPDQQASYAGSFYDPPGKSYSGGIFTPVTTDNFESGGIGSEFDDEPPLLEGN